MFYIQTTHRAGHMSDGLRLQGPDLQKVAFILMYEGVQGAQSVSVYIRCVKLLNLYSIKSYMCLCVCLPLCVYVSACVMHIVIQFCSC